MSEEQRDERIEEQRVEDQQVENQQIEETHTESEAVVTPSTPATEHEAPPQHDAPSQHDAPPQHEAPPQHVDVPGEEPHPVEVTGVAQPLGEVAINTETGQGIHVEHPVTAEVAPHRATEAPVTRTERPKREDGQKGEARPKSDRPKREKQPRREKLPIKRERKETKRFVVVSWSAQREPADDLYWCELEREGTWLVVTALEQVRTRREILERLTELDEGIVAFDFNFGYPEPFMDFVSKDHGAADVRSLFKRVRDDLKKNTDDGIRTWIERMGRYRESSLDTTYVPPRRYDRNERYGNERHGNERYGNDRFGGNQRQAEPEPLAPHEMRSTAERFRRTELTIRRAAEEHLTSGLHIGYNKLTNRYEFTDRQQRARGSLIGMSMLEQLVEAKPDVAIWPFAKPGKLTLVEVHPWIFTRMKTLPAAEFRKMIAVEEDGGLEITSQARDLAARNPDAQRTLMVALGIKKAETREDRATRPLRDYPDSFYDDQRVKKEGWFYGVGYRVEHPTETETPREGPRKILKMPPKTMPKREPRSELAAKPSEAPTAVEEPLASTAPEVIPPAVEAIAEPQVAEAAPAVETTE